jgi:hypothetical protein
LSEWKATHEALLKRGCNAMCLFAAAIGFLLGAGGLICGNGRVALFGVILFVGGVVGDFNGF